MAITDYKGRPGRELPSDASLPDELNAIYAPFDASNTEAFMRAPAVMDDYMITLPAGPDGLPGCVRRACAGKCH
jgi:hypothetical protein